MMANIAGRTTIVFDGKVAIPINYEIGLKPILRKPIKKRDFSCLVDEFLRLPISIEGVLSEWVVFYFEIKGGRYLVEQARTALFATSYNQNSDLVFVAQTKIIETAEHYELWARKVIGKPSGNKRFSIEDCKRIARNPNWWRKAVRY